MPDRVDVVVVGASVGGCAAATLFARRGLRVALVERRPNPGAYKLVCTHFLQASATPMLRRHGFAEAIERAGGLPNSLSLWTRYGWLRQPADAHPVRGYNIRREVLDPMLRRIATETPGVQLHLGQTVRELRFADGRVGGVVAVAKDGTRRVIEAPLTVAADGRGSRVARLAGVRGRVLPHGRFAYFSYIRGLPRRGDGASDVWFLDPDACFAFPNDDDLTLISVVPSKERLPEFKADLERAWMRFVAALPDGPPIHDAERVSPFVGALDLPNVYRPAGGRGLAFVGDAACAADPIWGVGCGWALQAAEWLVEETAQDLLERRCPDTGLGRYRHRHRAELLGHHLACAHYATARKFTAGEKLLFAGAAHDAKLRADLHEFASRLRKPHDFIAPRTLARAAASVARARADTRPAISPVRVRPRARRAGSGVP